MAFVDIPAAVLAYPAKVDTGKSGWSKRDVCAEIVVPVDVFEELGDDMYAGQFVFVTALATGAHTRPITHAARIIPVELCKGPLLTKAAVDALDVNGSTCTTSTGKHVALLSPLLAHNLGLPYYLAQLLYGTDLKRWATKPGMIRITAITSDTKQPAGPSAFRPVRIPGNMKQDFPVATHVGLAFCHTVEKPAPFDISDQQDSLLAALQGGKDGGPGGPNQDDDKDAEIEKMVNQRMKKIEDDNMEALQMYMEIPHVVCLGDIIAIAVKSTPEVGVLQMGAGSESDARTESVVFLKVVELTAQQGGSDHKNEAVDYPVLWPRKGSDTFPEVMICGSAGAVIPPGVEGFLLDKAPDTPAPTASDPASDACADSAVPLVPLTPARLGRSVYAPLEPHHVIADGKLLNGLWRNVAEHLLPFMHPVDGAGSVGAAGGPGPVKETPHTGRMALLLTGPERGGKAMEVHAAARALGMQAMEIDGRSVAVGNMLEEAECVSSLIQMLHQAQMYAPVVLVLRHLERVFHSQVNPQVVKRFADVLTKATGKLCRPHVPEIQFAPVEGAVDDKDPQEPPPLANLPWSAIHSHRARQSYEDTPRGEPQADMTRARLAALHERFPPGVVLVVATTSQPADIPVALRRCFTVDFNLAAPAQERRELALRCALGETCALDASGATAVAQVTAGFLPCDLSAVACDAACQVLTTELDRSAPVGHLRGRIGKGEVDATLEGVRKRKAVDVSAPRVPNVRWDDVGGLEHVKKTIMETIEVPLKYRSLFSSGIKRRSGVLMYGPPGTGKTLMAKAIANECSINFVSVKGPELINPYVGESEHNVRLVFERARAAQPCILFFDELDSLAPKRGTGSSSAHVTERVVAQLLTELDGFGSGRDDVFMIGATNRPDLLDDALMRPGRLDVLLYVGVDRAPAAKLQVLKALTRKFDMGPDVSLEELAEGLPPQVTGADSYGLCADAWMHAVRRSIRELKAAGRVGEDSDEGHDVDNVQIQVTMQDFWDAHSNLVPSLTEKDLGRYDQLQERYGGGGGGGGVTSGAWPQGSASASSTASAASASESARAATGGPSGPRLPPRRKPQKTFIQEEPED